ncbi:hypothetical protein [Nocardia rhizosphaerihabitans]|uniref:DUF4267 domain-containing protein n=1 Tax=Nocardia rhizosphaerihabitans TaxID=1691570 RepID=A0ABQ2KXF0_9NOCA|nr:hypothetical protein [Nocardia rhizosphaerihabitans]GGN94410.1 hypothetical protein GCM10011610_57360 [Nocardia rhizosphaerihabitans]
MKRQWPFRLLGLATAAYGASVAVRPEVLLRPCGFETDRPGNRALARMVGCRDAISGAAMVLAPDARVAWAAAGVRIAADLADALVLGAAVDPRLRRTAIAVPLVWGLLGAGSTALAWPRRPVAARP